MSGLSPYDSNAERIPPTLHGPIVTPPPSAWPSVFGIIMMIVGGFATLGGCMGALSPFFIEFFQDFISQVAPNEPTGLETMGHWMPYLVAQGIVALGLGVLCFIAGMGLFKRRASGVRHARWWALAKIAFIIPNLALQILMQMDNIRFMKEQMASKAASSAAPVDFMSDMMIVGAVVGAVVGLLWQLALPLTVLIWLRRGVIRREVAGWT